MRQGLTYQIMLVYKDEDINIQYIYVASVILEPEYLFLKLNTPW